MMRELITEPADLSPSTTWAETCWAYTPEESLVNHRRKARVCVATLLPFADGKPDWQGFENSVRWMLKCGEYYGVDLVFVLNADTGYIFELSLPLYREVIERFRSTFPEPTIICGTTAVGAQGDDFKAEWYRPHLDIAQSFDKVEVMIMTSRQLNQLPAQKRRDAYFEIAEDIKVPMIVHALEPSFVPWATPYDPWLLHQLACHEKIVAGKISTLDEPHFLYWAAMCGDLGLDFAPHSGDDYGIATAIRLGLPLLIGAGVSACPLICAARDMWLFDSCDDKAHSLGVGGDHFDTRVYKLFEAFQSLEDSVFRLNGAGSAAAYKHSTAACLKLMGLIATDEVHPDCTDRRAGDEVARMREALRRPMKAAQILGIPDFEMRES
ncbi:MAG: hypothetical protein L3J39_13330 [Verrucomicrobiales bacterium]|nr:hypothetical protein [Verrucomicrobiales bacterium]